MPSSTEIIIISGYKQKVSYYGLPAMPAWALVAIPLVIGFALAKVL
jgi:hypothetical protein